MSDLISRKAIIKAIEELPNCYNGWSDAYDKAYIITTIEEVPTTINLVRCKDCKHSKNCVYPAKWNWCPDGERKE